MENFNELFASAKEIADRRNKVFNELIEKTKAEILPEFCESCAALGIKILYFEFWNAPILKYHDVSFTDELNDKCYGLAIDVENKKIAESNVDMEMHASGEKYRHSYYEATESDLNEAELTKVGIVSFIKELNGRINVLNQQYAKKVAEAEVLLTEQTK